MLCTASNTGCTTQGLVLLQVVGQSERGRLLMTRGGVVPNFAELDSIHVFCTDRFARDSTTAHQRH